MTCPRSTRSKRPLRQKKRAPHSRRSILCPRRQRRRWQTRNRMQLCATTEALARSDATRVPRAERAQAALGGARARRTRSAARGAAHARRGVRVRRTRSALRDGALARSGEQIDDSAALGGGRIRAPRRAAAQNASRIASLALIFPLMFRSGEICTMERQWRVARREGLGRRCPPRRKRLAAGSVTCDRTPPTRRAAARIGEQCASISYVCFVCNCVCDCV